MKRRLSGILLFVFVLGACRTGSALSSPSPSPTESPVVTETGNPVSEEQAPVEGQSGQETNTATPAAPASDEPVIMQREVVIVQPYDEPGMQLLGQLNAWRISLGLWPLSPNAALDALALDQAAYLSGLAVLPDDLHAGPGGEYPPERALAAGWPFYNNTGQVAVTEIAYIGFGVEAAITWWQGSSIHTRSVTNPAFREVGITAIPYLQGSLFLVLLGGRPNMLPALYEPLSNVLYLSSEQYTWSAGDRIQDATQYQLLLSADQPVDDSAWQPWQPTVPVPEGFGDRYAIAYTDGLHVTISEIDLSRDIAWLPENLAVPTVTVIESPVVAEVPAAEGPVAEATPTPAAETPGDGIPDIKLVYGQISLTIINIPPGESLDISGIELVVGDITLPVSAWDTEFLGVPLNEFTVGSCLQTWDVTQADPGIPASCYLRASVVYLPIPEIFWVKGPFEVRQNGATVATCPQAASEGATTCEVDLP